MWEKAFAKYAHPDDIVSLSLSLLAREAGVRKKSLVFPRTNFVTCAPPLKKEAAYTVCDSNYFASITCPTSPRRIHFGALA